MLKRTRCYWSLHKCWTVTVLGLGKKWHDFRIENVRHFCRLWILFAWSHHGCLEYFSAPGMTDPAISAPLGGKLICLTP